MSITCLAGSLYTLQRLSPFVLDSVSADAGGHAVDRQPPTPSAVQVKATAAGTVTVAGTVGGGSDTEALTFTGAGFKTTTKQFSALTTLTPAGALLGTAIEAKALGADGTPHPKLKANVRTGLRGAFTPGRPKWAPQRPGRVEQRGAMIAFDWSEQWEIRRGDFLLDEGTGDRWRVEGTNLLRGRWKPHHVEVWVSSYDGEAPG